MSSKYFEVFLIEKWVNIDFIYLDGLHRPYNMPLKSIVWVCRFVNIWKITLYLYFQAIFMENFLDIISMKL